jgi:hypothetical protein
LCAQNIQYPKALDLETFANRGNGTLKPSHLKTFLFVPKDVKAAFVDFQEKL